MHHFTFSLVVNATDLEDGYYRRGIQKIVVTTDEGLRIQLPVRRFAPYISAVGIRGRFQLTLDSQNRFVCMQKIGEV